MQRRGDHPQGKELSMDTEHEPRSNDGTAPAQSETGEDRSVSHPVVPVPKARRMMRYLGDIPPSPGSNVSRIYGISDCVIAVAFTLFVVNIRLPPAGLSESQLQNYIVHNILSDIPFYLISYLVVVNSWISHYRIFSYTKRSSSLYIILNVVFMASIVFLPVPVAFFYFYGNLAGAWQLFAATQVVTSTTLLLMWVVARADHLLDQNIPPDYLQYTTARLLIVPLGTLLSIGVAFYNVWVAEGIFLIMYVLLLILRGVFYRHHPRENSLEGTIRMCSITDNMTAVAITFLIATITGTLLSDVHQPFSTSLKAVLEELPVYGFSLLIVGFFWLSHHRMFMIIRRHNITLIYLNFAFLLFIEFQPLFNGLHASYPTSQLTTILYASNQVLTGLMLIVIWWYAAQRHRLIDPSIDRSTSMLIALRVLLTPIIFILSIAIILFRNDYAIWIWLLLIVVEVVDLIYRRIERAALSREGRTQLEAEV
jgi:uncharacterized membrane protein